GLVALGDPVAVVALGHGVQPGLAQEADLLDDPTGGHLREPVPRLLVLALDGGAELALVLGVHVLSPPIVEVRRGRPVQTSEWVARPGREGRPRGVSGVETPGVWNADHPRPATTRHANPSTVSATGSIM